MTLPSGWVLARLGDIVEPIETDDPTQRPSEAFPYVDIGSIDNRLFQIVRPRTVLGRDAPSRARRRIQSGDVLFSTVRTYLKNIATVPPDLNGAITSTGICVLRPTDAIQPGFLFRRVVCQDFVDAMTLASDGTMYPAISDGDLFDAILALPPLAEQRRIVAKLDALTARLARARAELDRVVLLVPKLRMGALRSIFHFDTNDMPPGWRSRPISQIGHVQLGRQRSPKDHDGPNMRPYLRSANITWNGWDLSDVKSMNFSPAEFETFRLENGDVLLNEGSGSAKEVGKPAVWRDEIADICFQNTLLRIRPHTYNSDLLRFCLLYLALSGQFIEKTQGVNIIHIGKAGLAKFMIPVPPESEQEALLAGLKTAFAHADRLEAEATRARALLDRLESALLAKAFRGELVPQDPNDEPASVLLDRIRAARAAQPKPARGRAPRGENPAKPGRKPRGAPPPP